MIDLTYNVDEIRANPIWDLAFVLSEIKNDDAPLEWSMYIPLAKTLLSIFDIKRKDEK